jgi:hypothetical protein
VTDAAIHRVSEDADGVVSSGSKDQWIATGYALAMTSVVLVRNVCHCEEDSMDNASIYRVSEDVDRKLRFVTFPTFTFHPSIFTLPPYIGSQWIATGFSPRGGKGEIGKN